LKNNPIGSPYPTTISEQQPAIDALMALTALFGSLPPAYITVTDTAGNHVALQLDSPHDFEVWREALRIPPGSVSWHVFNASVWISASTEVYGAVVGLSGHNVPVSSEVAKVSPAEDAERHQLDDAAEAELAADPGLPSAWSAAAVSA